MQLGDRRMQQKKVTPMERLIKRVCRNKVTLFIGAGFSIKAGAPSVSDLIQKLIKDGELCYKDDVKNLKLCDVASDFVEKEDRHELMKVLYKHFSFTPADTSDQKLLASIPHFKKIFTTNYDSLIESAYPKGKCVVLTSSQGCSNDECAPVKIYKIHGDISTMSDPDSIIITNEDYEDYFNKKSLKILWEDLKHAFIHTYVVFVGYSLADENIFEIVKKVREDLNGNAKEMYLVSPDRSLAHNRRLSANGITYIRNTGEGFLKTLQKTIDDTIVKDFEEAKLEDSRVFNEYMLQHGLCPIIQYGLDKNVIGQVKGLNGKSVDTRMNLKVSKDIVDAINARMYNASQNIPGTKFTLPAYQIDASSLIDGELRFNDILFANKSDWERILVLPCNEIKELTIKVPSADFMETTQVLVYNNGKNSVGFKIDIKIGEICIVANFKDGKPIGKVNANVELYDTYGSSSEALRWVEVPIALFSGKLVNFQIFGIEEKPKDEYPLREYNRIKRYYQTIKSLELDHNIQFASHDNYSKDGLMCALILESYLGKHGISYGLMKTFKCEVDTTKGNSEAQDLIKSKKPSVMAITYVNFSGMLNGYEFCVPYVNICLMHCVVRDYHKIKGSIYSLKMVDEAAENLIYGSDTPAEPEGNKLNLQS